MSVQIINLGLPKSGTTTLHHALKAAGYRVADHRLKSSETESSGRVFVGTLMYDGLYQHGDPLALLHDYDALTEVSFIHGGQSIWPQCDHAMLLALRRLHPRLRFVATRRATEDLAGSIMRWNNLGTGRLPRAQVPGMPKGYGHGIDEQMIWIDGHYEALAHWFRDDPLYLEIDVAAPGTQQRLADFLGQPMPWWGRANVNKGADTARKNRKAPD